MRIDGHTRLAAVVATPIKHSISPFIHNTAFEMTGVNGVYVAWDIPREELAVTVENVRRYDMFGINISMPYKQDVIQYLDEITPAAQLIGAVNTVVNRDGKLIGYNTDGQGFFKSLPNFDVKGKVMTILGGGGAATAIITQAALNQAHQIHIFNQAPFLEETEKRAAHLSEKTGVAISVHDIDDKDLIQELADQADLLVNATSVGMDGQSMVVSPNMTIKEGLLVADVIYQPFETPFLKFVRSQGATAVNGLGMLLYQAAEAFELWTGQEMPAESIWNELASRYQ